MNFVLRVRFLQQIQNTVKTLIHLVHVYTNAEMSSWMNVGYCHLWWMWR